MPKANKSIFDALLRKWAIEGAMNPRIIRGTRKNIICPVMCFIQITTSSTASLTTKPANSPIITAISSCTMVLLRNFFIYFFIIKPVRNSPSYRLSFYVLFLMIWFYRDSNCTGFCALALCLSFVWSSP